MKEREKLETKLRAILKSEVTKTKLVSGRFLELKQLGIIESSFSRFLHLREDVSAASDFILYCLCKVYCPNDVKDFFLPKEIKQYDKLKIEEEKLVMPLVLKVVKISDQQWIGCISAKELMLWRNAQIINYNENAQRALKHIIRHGRDFYKISLNNKSVNSIMNLMESASFIPNTLTFNIPDDVDYEYDDSNLTLTINLDNQKLDILDGYHRYIAISKELSKNPDFDYNMEVRLVQFSESDAQQFIWQEDQKNRMTKSQSEAMNQHKLANQIAQRVNDNGACDLYHHITANGIVNKGYFAQMVDKMYCKNVAKKSELKVQKDTVVQLTDYLNVLVEQEPELSEKTWDRVFTYCALFMSDKTKDINEVNRLYDKVKAEDKYIFSGQEITGTDMGKLTRLWKGE